MTKMVKRTQTFQRKIKHMEFKSEISLKFLDEKAFE